MSAVAFVFNSPRRVYDFVMSPQTAAVANASLGKAISQARRAQACFFRADKENPLSRTIASFPDDSDSRQDRLFVLMTKRKKNDVPITIIPKKKRVKMALMAKRGVLDTRLPLESFKRFVVIIERVNEVIRADHPNYEAEVSVWKKDLAVRNATHSKLKGCPHLAVPTHWIWSEDGTKYYSFQPYFESGDLDLFIQSRFLRKCSLDLQIDLFRDIVLGIQELYQKGFVHLDLKPLNVFLKVNQSTGGLSGFVGDLDDIRAIDCPSHNWFALPTDGYGPPEAHQRNPRLEKPPFDIWALGCILYEMITEKRSVPVTSAAELASMKETVRNNPFASCLTSLMTGLLNPDPDQRLTLKQILHYLAPENRDRLKALRPTDSLWDLEPEQPARKRAHIDGSAASSREPIEPPSARKSSLRFEFEDDED